MTHSLQHEPFRVVPKRRVITRMILREFLGRMDHLRVELSDRLMHRVDGVPGFNDERQVLQAGTVT